MSLHDATVPDRENRVAGCQPFDMMTGICVIKAHTCRHCFLGCVCVVSCFCPVGSESHVARVLLLEDVQPSRSTLGNSGSVAPAFQVLISVSPSSP